MKRPSLDELRMLFGFLLLVIVAFICVAIALGKVEEATSFGLTQIITVLASLAGGFSNWAFSTWRNNKNEAKNQAVASQEESDISK